MSDKKSYLLNMSPITFLKWSIALSTFTTSHSAIAANKSKVYKNAKERVENLCANLLTDKQGQGLQAEVKKALKLIKKSTLKYKESTWINDPGIVDLSLVELVSTDSEFADPEILNLPRTSYNLDETQDINYFITHVEDLLAIRDKQKANPLPEGEEFRFRIGGDVKTGLKTLLSLGKIIQPANKKVMQMVLGSDYEDTLLKAKAMIKYISIAINRNYSSPIPDRLGAFSAIAMFFDNISSFNSPGHNPGGEATNLKDPGKASSDPVASALWKKRKTPIAEADTYAGYDLPELPNLQNLVSTYLKPKTGFGTRAGNRTIIDTSNLSGAEIAALEKELNMRLIEFIDDKGIIQIKVRINVESRTGTFGPKLIHPLGFKTNKIHFGGTTEIKYDRRIFQEYNSRGQFGTKVVLIPGTNLGPQTKRQKVWDPFGDIQGAKLKNGQIIDKQSLERMLLIDTTRSVDNIPEYLRSSGSSKTALNNFTDSNFDTKGEDAIDTILIEPVSIQVINPYRDSVGSFEWAPLQNSREARGLGLLFGLLNLHDVRSENTRLNIVDYSDLTDAIKEVIKSKQTGVGLSTDLVVTQGVLERLQLMDVTELLALKKSLESEEGMELMLSDLGSNLGTSKGFGRYKGQDVNGMLWEIMTVKTSSTGQQRVTMDSFRPNQENLAAEAMNIEDARWMGNKFAKLTETQILADLISSGYTAPFARLYLEKIVSRRDEMVRELGLNAKLMRPHGPNKLLSLDQYVNTISATLPNGKTVVAKKSKSWILSQGQIVHVDTGLPYDPDVHHLD